MKILEGTTKSAFVRLLSQILVLIFDQHLGLTPVSGHEVGQRLG